MGSIYKTEHVARTIREWCQHFLTKWVMAHQQLRVGTRHGETFIVASGKPDAPPLVLLHGTLANSAVWMGDVPAWAADFRVYAVDVIGEPGLSAPVRLPLDSDAHALWLDDVFDALSIPSASLVGVSFGGWLALDYATRRPERVKSLVLICPGGIGRQKLSIVLKTIPLRLFGRWGSRKAQALVQGRAPGQVTEAQRHFMDFTALVDENFRPRRVKMPLFSDEALRRLTMPVLAILGGNDVLLDSAETKRRLDRNLPNVDIRFYPEQGHYISGQTALIHEFLLRSVLGRSDA